MEWINYHHLLYFWTVAKEGGVSQAARALRLAQPTVSGQIKALEESLGLKLFDRVGRRLQLTEDGHVAYRYAEEIFGLGSELQETLKGRSVGRTLKLRVGVSDSLPKLVIHDLLAPALQLDRPVQISCHGDKTDRLLAELAVHGLDMVLSDVPVGGNVRVKAFNHLLGECGMGFFGTKELATRYRAEFPNSLDAAPVLLPSGDTVIRRALDQWFDKLGVKPQLVAEFDDSGLMKSFGKEGTGIFVAPTVVADEIAKQYEVELVGQTNEVTERFYAITIERRIKNPAVAAISESAKHRMFASTSPNDAVSTGS